MRRLRAVGHGSALRVASWRSVRTCALRMRCAATGAPGLVSTLDDDRHAGAQHATCSATSAGTRMRTGRRCTILVKLPVALSGGSSENTEPEAGAKLATRPSMLRGRAARRR